MPWWFSDAYRRSDVGQPVGRFGLMRWASWRVRAVVWWFVGGALMLTGVQTLGATCRAVRSDAVGHLVGRAVV